MTVPLKRTGPLAKVIGSSWNRGAASPGAARANWNVPAASPSRKVPASVSPATVPANAAVLVSPTSSQVSRGST
jgi:hypothetical protein